MSRSTVEVMVASAGVCVNALAHLVGCVAKVATEGDMKAGVRVNGHLFLGNLGAGFGDGIIKFQA